MHRFAARAAVLVAVLLPACGSGEREGDDEGEGLSDPEICSTQSVSHVDEGADMAPGGDCIGCHARSGEGPAYTIAGTVMAASHDDTNCNGIDAVQVVITGADNGVITLDTNGAGNFFTSQPIATPFKAKVVRAGKEIAMVAAQSVGDCNTCHTAQGASGAPGRIVAP